MKPRVSICLPTLNSSRFLPERLDSIRQQTLSEWELIAVDSYSDDGTFEKLTELAREDGRVSVHQAPPDGIYANINRCIERARGDYVYVATSDDTMAANCLEQLVSALDSYPDCGLAHCRVKLIDERGEDAFDWWSPASIFTRSSGKMVDVRHVRKAPFDGILHLIGDSVYTSLTQLLIRRSLFAQLGYFESQWGSIGDFNWDMRATLVTDTIHEPSTWAGWRVHSTQATASAAVNSEPHRRKIEEMIDHAVRSSQAKLPKHIRKPLVSRWIGRMKSLRSLVPGLRARIPARRRIFLSKQIVLGSWAARHHLVARYLEKPSPLDIAPDLVRSWLEEKSGSPVMVSAQDLVEAVA